MGRGVGVSARGKAGKRDKAGGPQGRGAGAGPEVIQAGGLSRDGHSRAGEEEEEGEG